MEIQEEIAAQLALAKQKYPGFALVPKRESAFMKALYYGSFMFIWNRAFMTRFTTTIGRKIYVVKEFEGVHGLALLRHELQHIEDSKRFPGPVWGLLYLFPQSLSLVALLAFWQPWLLFFLVFLLPLPAPFRVWVEFRGYAMTMLTRQEHGYPMNEDDIARLKNTFTGWSYYKMCWNWSLVEPAFREIMKDPVRSVDS